MQLEVIGLSGFSGSCKRNTVIVLHFVLPIAIRWVCPGCVTSSDPHWSCQKCNHQAHLQHILLDKQNLCELESFRCFPLLFLFGSSSTTVLLNLVYSFNYHGWYNWKMSNSIKFLKVVCCICAESFIYLHYFRKLWRVVKYMLSYSPQRQQKLLFTFLNS